MIKILKKIYLINHFNLLIINFNNFYVKSNFNEIILINYDKEFKEDTSEIEFSLIKNLVIKRKKYLKSIKRFDKAAHYVTLSTT